MIESETDVSVSRPDADSDPVQRYVRADATDVPLSDGTADVIVTSPPYYQKRDYGVDGQLGQEGTVEEYVDAVMACVEEMMRVLKDSGSLFFNVGDTYQNKCLQGIPSRFHQRFAQRWNVRNRIVWKKQGGGMPDAVSDRHKTEHEYVFHVTKSDEYWFDEHAIAHVYNGGSLPGDVWEVPFDRNDGTHKAPFPEGLVRRCLVATAPPYVCSKCGLSPTRELRRTDVLDTERYQSRRAMELYEESDLTFDHIRALQSAGITDGGKAASVQDGTGRNTEEVRSLAAEAREVLGSYAREFTFAMKETSGWSDCDCAAPTEPPLVVDPFVGTGTTVDVASECGCSAVGLDIDLSHVLKESDHFVR